MVTCTLYTRPFTGFFYYQLGNISPQFRSSLKSIQLVAVANSSVIVKYGSNKILEPFMADLRKLEHVCSVVEIK